MEEYIINSDTSRSEVLIDRIYHTIVEDGNNLDYGDFSNRVHANGLIRVLKVLGLYKLEGRGENRKCFIHPKLKLVFDTTVKSNKLISNAIIDLVNGKYINLEKIKIDDNKIYNLESYNYEQLSSISNTYFIFDPETKLIKIGKSKNITKRLKSLKNEFGDGLILIGYLKKDEEAFYHQIYKHQRVYKEWFNIGIDEVIDNVRGIKFI